MCFGSGCWREAGREGSNPSSPLRARHLPLAHRGALVLSAVCTRLPGRLGREAGNGPPRTLPKRGSVCAGLGWDG